MKEHWLDDGGIEQIALIPEHLVQEGILKAASKGNRAILEKHFFTILAHELLVFNVVSKEGDPPPPVQHRFHYRVMLQEVVTPLYDVEHLNHVFIALRDSVEVLCCMAECGWVYQDISARNVYYHNGRGLIGDLEYAKPEDIGSGRTSDDQTGVFDYMATEILGDKHIFLPSRPGDIAALNFYHISLIYPIVYEQPKNTTNNPERPKDPPFTHVPLHDVESLWWIAICRVIRNKIISEGVPNKTDWFTWAKQLKVERKIFPGSGGSTYDKRKLFFLHFGDPVMFMLPSYLEKVGYKLDLVKIRLLRLYSVMEFSLVDERPALIVNEYGREALAGIKCLFDDCAELSKGMIIQKFKSHELLEYS